MLSVLRKLHRKPKSITRNYATKQRFYKVTNAKEIHNGFVYKDGLNILDKKFNRHGSCVAGGLYFTNLYNLHNFYAFEIHLREIFLPLDDPDFQMVIDPNGGKWRANKIILGNKYSLLDPKTYQKFGLDISENPYFLIHAKEMGMYEELKDKWINPNINWEKPKLSHEVGEIPDYQADLCLPLKRSPELEVIKPKVIYWM